MLVLILIGVAEERKRGSHPPTNDDTTRIVVEILHDEYCTASIQIRGCEMHNHLLHQYCMKVGQQQQQQQYKILRSGAPWIKVNEGEPVEWKIVIFCP